MTDRIRHRSTSLALILLFMVSLIVTQGCDDGASRPVGLSTTGFNSANAMGIVFRWKLDGALLRVNVVAPTRGWVGVGFAPSARMQDANIILGYVVGDRVYVSDEYGSGPTLHQPDVYAGGTNDVIDAVGREYNGFTEISFAIPLDSGDLRDRVLLPGRNQTVMLAYGPDTADEFTTLHATRTIICVLF